MANEHIILSFIIPVYNVEHYVSKCINSCLEQNLDTTNFEIIIVDDGSTDSTQLCICKFITNHPEVNFVLLRQKNKGQSAARNVGLEHAQGKYIWFVDGDDQVLKGVVKGMLTTAVENDLDMWWCNHTLENEMGGSLPLPKEDKKTNVSMLVHSGPDFLVKSFNHSCMICMFLIRKSFLTENGLKFEEGIYLEDILFILKAIYCCQRIQYYDCVVYEYLIRSNSTMRSPDKLLKRAKDSFFVAKKLVEFNTYVVIEPNVKKWINDFVNLIVQYNLRRLVKARLWSDFDESITYLYKSGVCPLQYANNFKIREILDNHFFEKVSNL